MVWFRPGLYGLVFLLDQFSLGGGLRSSVDWLGLDKRFEWIGLDQFGLEQCSAVPVLQWLIL
jgi:hypothetical protein